MARFERGFFSEALQTESLRYSRLESLRYVGEAREAEVNKVKMAKRVGDNGVRKP